MRIPANRSERLSVGWKINSLPKPTPSPAEVRRVLLAAIDAGNNATLPAGWDVTWIWRNAPHLPQHHDEFAKTVRESSRGGFREIMAERIERDFTEIERRRGR